MKFLNMLRHWIWIWDTVIYDSENMWVTSVQLLFCGDILAQSPTYGSQWFTRHIQEKINDLFQEFKFIRTNIDNLLILTRSDWEYHLAKLKRIITKFKESGIKCDTKKYFFSQNEIEYLGFWWHKKASVQLIKKLRQLLI